jgi:hypothetical protein
MNHSEAGKLGAEKSRETRKNQQQLRVDTYNENPKHCHNCEQSLPYEKRKNNFCGSSCFAIHSNSVVPRDHESHWKKKYEECPKHCEQCNNKLGFKERHNRFCFSCGECGKCCNCGQSCKYSFCCLQCSADFRWKQLKDEMERTGVARAVRTAKRYLMEKDAKCQICRNNTWEGKPLPLILDHIDGNSENWNLSNLRLVCSNCDSLLPTYKSKNRGNGRAFRRLRYKNGQSY